jgi:hypothetical protein
MQIVFRTAICSLVLAAGPIVAVAAMGGLLRLCEFFARAQVGTEGSACLLVCAGLAGFVLSAASMMAALEEGAL